jgi:hypothetical protein
MNTKLRIVGHAAQPVDLDRLAKMQPAELHQLHRRIFGTDVASGNPEQARRRIAWHIQAERLGGLPESARQHALGISRESGLRIRAGAGARYGKSQTALPHATVSQLLSDHDSRLPMPGSVIVKEYRGRTILVQVLGARFEYNGRRFDSLSAIAQEITGTKWNGFAFFGLAKGKARGR